VSGANCHPDFVANEQETERFHIDSIIQERPLRELYLRPFEIAIREANPWAVMSSYNLVNGVHADMNEHTLKDILRKEWQYDGLDFPPFFLSTPANFDILEW
jgi:beta-glucosidase